ncbi:MAG: dienelactone hydrolase family protein [Solirubrobacterales bacterium]
MAEIVLFHHAQGMRPDVIAWAERLRADGHRVWTPDLYEGATFDKLDEGVAHRDSIGIPTLIRRAEAELEPLPAGVVYMGFSMGAPTAGYFAVRRPGARGAVLMHGGADPGDGWPAGVPVQLHYAVGDPWIETGEIAPFAAAVEASGSPVEIHTYPGPGHLFADPDGPDYDRESAELMLERELEFLRRL